MVERAKFRSMGHEGDEAGDCPNHVFERMHHRVGFGLLSRHQLLWRGRLRLRRPGTGRLCFLLGFRGNLKVKRPAPLRDFGRVGPGDHDVRIRFP